MKLIREDFSEVLTEVGEEDVDWDAWRPLYEQRLSPRRSGGGRLPATAGLTPSKDA